MSVDRSELADILAEATGWSVTASPSERSKDPAG